MSFVEFNQKRTQAKLLKFTQITTENEQYKLGQHWSELFSVLGFFFLHNGNVQITPTIWECMWKNSGNSGNRSGNGTVKCNYGCIKTSLWALFFAIHCAAMRWGKWYCLNFIRMNVTHFDCTCICGAFFFACFECSSFICILGWKKCPFRFGISY